MGASAYSDTSQTVDLLVRQVTGRVRWTESMTYAAEQEITQLVEVGAGKVLSGLARRIDKRLSAVQAGSTDTIRALI